LIPARKRWGQHFLVRPEIAERIVDAARLRPSDVVLEIGPGEGALTRPLAARGMRVLAIEIDAARAAELARELGGNGRVLVIPGDARDRTYGEWLERAGWEGPAVLVSNLPYNAATPLVTRAVEEPKAISRAVVTVQREVARRFAARPGEEGYGFLSVRTAAFASARLLFDLPPSAFRPRPRVVSSVLELTPRPGEAAAALRDRALALASLGFRSRRKTLANALAGAAPKDALEAALAAMDKTPKARAEELSWPDYVVLARRVPEAAAGRA